MSSALRAFGVVVLGGSVGLPPSSSAVPVGNLLGNPFKGITVEGFFARPA